MQITQSKQLFSRAQQRIPGGVNSPVRAFKSVNMTPLFITRAQGSKLYDADGNEFIDFVGSWGPMILGHAHTEVVRKLEETLLKGTSFGAPTEGEILLAEMICEAVPSVEMLRLVNSGSEAAMAVLRVARGYTGRDKIIKFEGCYHGSVDPLLVQAGSGAMTLGIPDSPGIPASFVEHTLQAKFNDLDSVIKLVEENSSKIAAVIIEPVAGNMGMIPPEHGFLQGLRDLCDREGILLIFDEVMSGFRVDYGGAQALFGVLPDMSIFGKITRANSTPWWFSTVAAITRLGSWRKSPRNFPRSSRSISRNPSAKAARSSRALRKPPRPRRCSPATWMPMAPRRPARFMNWRYAAPPVRRIA